MLSDIRYWEQKASEGHYAIPHFNVWNAEMLMGVIDAAEELRAPVIISFGTGFVGNTSFEDFCYMMDSMAKKASVPVIMHWDSPFIIMICLIQFVHPGPCAVSHIRHLIHCKNQPHPVSLSLSDALSSARL